MDVNEGLWISIEKGRGEMRWTDSPVSKAIEESDTSDRAASTPRSCHVMAYMIHIESDREYLAEGNETPGHEDAQGINP